jgi:hypothetical protein
MEGGMISSDYDADLPFLAELEQRVRSYAEQTAAVDVHAVAESRVANAGGGSAGRIKPVVKSRRRARVPLGRMTRRTATLTGLLCLLAATALGAGSIFLGGGTARSPSVVVHQGPFVDLANGSAGSDRWGVRIYQRNRDVCRAFVLIEQQAVARCQPEPGPSAAQATLAVSATHSFVFGVAGARVASVLVRSGGSSKGAVTHPLPASARRATGMTGADRYFVISLIRPPEGNGEPLARVVALDSNGDTLGAPETLRREG